MPDRTRPAATAAFARTAVFNFLAALHGFVVNVSPSWWRWPRSG